MYKIFWQMVQRHEMCKKIWKVQFFMNWSDKSYQRFTLLVQNESVVFKHVHNRDMDNPLHSTGCTETSRNFFGVSEANWNYSIHRGWGIFENEIKVIQVSSYFNKRVIV